MTVSRGGRRRSREVLFVCFCCCLVGVGSHVDCVFITLLYLFMDVIRAPAFNPSAAKDN